MKNLNFMYDKLYGKINSERDEITNIISKEIENYNEGKIYDKINSYKKFINWDIIFVKN